MAQKRPEIYMPPPVKPFFKVFGLFAVALTVAMALCVIAVILIHGESRIWAAAISCMILFGLSLAFVLMFKARAERREGRWREIYEKQNESLGQYRRMIEGVPHAIALVDGTGKVRLFNSAFAELAESRGRSAREIDFFELADPVDRGILRHAFLKCSRGDSEIERFRINIDSEEGSEAHCEVSVIAFGKGADSVPVCQVVLRDVTRTLRQKGEIEQLVEFDRVLIERSSVGILVLDHDGGVKNANPAFIKIFDLKPDLDQIKNINIFEDDGLNFLDQFELETVFEEKRTICGIRQVEITGARNITASVDIFPILNGRGEIERIVLTIQDTTEQTRTEKELSAQEKRLDLLFNNIIDAVFISDLKGTITQVNPAAEKITGYSHDELAGLGLYELFTLDERELALQEFVWIKSGKSVHFESKFITPKGNSIDVDISGSLVDTGGESLSLIVVRDITERKRFLSRIAQTQKMESIGVMAGGIALDFNNILEAITGAAELAHEDVAADSVASSYLDVILDSAQRGANLTSHLLTYARQSVHESEILDLNELVLEVKSFLDHALNKKVSVRVELTPDIEPVIGDPSRLEQAIINLALNAHDAMPEGGEISIKTRPFAAKERFARDHPGLSPGTYIELIVQDTGSGIAPEILPKIFDPFFTTGEDNKNTGLGLAIVYNTVTSHGGAIDVHTVPQGGTEFRIYLPIHAAPDFAYEKRASLEKKFHRNKKIMVVDDEDVIQTVIEGILMQLGYEVVRALSGKEGLEYLTDTDGAVDLILLDMIMPGLSGWDVFRRLKEFWPHIPVIVVTGYAREEHIQYMFEEGLEGFIEKPFKAAQLSEKIDQILGDE